MFLCYECHKDEGCPYVHFFKSFGRCEDCGLKRECVDCKWYRVKLRGET